MGKTKTGERDRECEGKSERDRDMRGIERDIEMDREKERYCRENVGKRENEGKREKEIEREVVKEIEGEIHVEGRERKQALG